MTTILQHLHAMHATDTSTSLTAQSIVQQVSLLLEFYNLMKTTIPGVGFLSHGGGLALITLMANGTVAAPFIA
jgi:hypothetical protein